MRSEEKMFDLILGFAETDVRVRAVYMNGSRANPNAPRDKYMDFDIVYLVNEFDSLVSDYSWIDCFGKRLILQMPEAMRYPLGTGHFNWLILLSDGNRIDLTIIPCDKPELITNDSATVVLLDKDGILPKFPISSDADYITTAPSELFYTSCCNNFFWCMQNVAKGIVRDEFPYAIEMYNFIISDELNDMVAWYIGSQNNFSVSCGKMGKYFKNFLSAELYEQYVKLYPQGGNYDDFWSCIYSACDLFRNLAREVANKLGYTYETSEDDGIMTYLKMLSEDSL